MLARPADPDDPLLTNWSKRLIFNNTQRDPSGAWLTPDGEWRFMTWDQELFASKDFVAWQRLGQPAGLPVGDCPSLFALPAAVDGAAAPPLAAAPTHVHKISYDSRDFYTIG